MTVIPGIIRISLWKIGFVWYFCDFARLAGLGDWQVGHRIDRGTGRAESGGKTLFRRVKIVVNRGPVGERSLQSRLNLTEPRPQERDERLRRAVALAAGFVLRDGGLGGGQQGDGHPIR